MAAAQRPIALGHALELAPLCSVLVPSCDAYSDLWQPFVTLFFRYWPDCPFPVHLGSNVVRFQHARVQMAYAGHGTNWSNRVREQVENLRTPYVLLTLEDFFLRRPVSTSDVLEAFTELRQRNGAVLRLVTRPGPDRDIADSALLGELSRGAPYRVSTQAAIWHRETLLQLMRPSESIWEFELSGSRRSDELSAGFFGVKRDLLPYDHHVVERGKWFRNEARRYGSMNVGCDFGRRPVMSRGESLRWHVAKARGVMLGLVPWRPRKRIVRGLKRLLGRPLGPGDQ